MQIAALGGMAASYFVLWQMVAPPDPAGPLVFLADGAPGRLSVLAGVLCMLAAVCGVLTVGARPAGAMTALAVAGGGLTLHSQSIRALLWVRGEDIAGLYQTLVLELVVLAGLMLVAMVVLGVARGIASALLPRLAWQDPSQRAGGSSGGGRGGVIGTFFKTAAMPVSSKDEAVKLGLCFLADVAISTVLILLLARSMDRGQVLFALFAGCGGAAMLAQTVVPVKSNLAALAAPLVVGACLYVLAAVGAVETGPQAWMAVPAYAQALPIDWVTAALGGSMLGEWAILRMREAKAMEHKDVQDANE